MRSPYLVLTLTCLSLFSCKTLRPQTAELTSLPINCQEPIALQDYLKADTSCTADGFFKSPEEARKRDLSPWIPCNDVEWIDDTQDFFGPGAGNDVDTLELSTYQRIVRDWLGKADRFTPEMASRTFQNLEQPLAFNQDNPILDSAMARAVKDLIQSAQHNIVMDVFLLGGSWGSDIMHDLAAAAERGVEVLVIHDNVSKFSVANEMDPLWQAAQQFSLKHPRFVALDANLRTPARNHVLPVNYNSIAPAGTGLFDLKVGPTSPGDRSKVLIIDGLYQKTPDEYTTLKPRALVMSRDLVDSAGSFHHDEGVIIRGPAAVVTLLHYQADVFWAWEQAKQSKKINAADESLLQSMHGRMEKLRQTPTLVKGQGWVSVQPIQISVNDEIRNLDSSIIPRIMAAERSIDLYGRFAYNWPLAMALKEAMARGVKVRIILNQPSPMVAHANGTLPYMMAKAPRRLPSGQESIELLDENRKVIEEGDLPVKWFLPIRPGKQFGSKDRSDLSQELHASTIIIDGRLALFGSASLDSLTWSLGFREYSVWVDDPALASESARQFDRLWNHPFLTVSHKTWLGDEEPAKEVLQYLIARRDAAGCDPKAELCQPETIFQGGKNRKAKKPTRDEIKTVLVDGADQSYLLIPAKILQDQGRPLCRKLQ